MKNFQADKEEGFLRQYFKAFRFYLITGLMVWTPLLVTVWLSWWLFKNVGLGIESIIEEGYAFLNRLGERFPNFHFLRTLEYKKGFGFLTAVALFLTTGFLARNLIGQRFIRATEQLVGRVPGVNKIYRAVRQIRDVFVGRGGAVFQQVCMVEYPRPGIFAVGFITSTDEGIVQQTMNRELIAVFVPTTPNPTSGFLLYLHPSEVIKMDVSVEEAMKLIMSGGAYIPGNHDDDDDSDERPHYRKIVASGKPKKSHDKSASGSAAATTES